MIAFTPSGPAGEQQFATSDRLGDPPPTYVVVKSEAAPPKAQKYVFRQQIIPLDDGCTLLRLREAPVLAVDPKTMQFEVETWGIKMKCEQVEDLPRQIARRFITLFSKADRDEMGQSERLEWIKILDKVDFAQFSIERSAPHYAEGTLVKKYPLIVEWHDGTTEYLAASLTSVFYPFDPGDNFSAFVKIGKERRTLGIERISLIPA